MPRLIQISYRGHPYPMGITPALYELPGHFDRRTFLTNRPYCLHTEYSAGPRHKLLEDGSPRYFLPEVNSSKEDVQSIVSDFVSTVVEFMNDPIHTEGQKR